MQQMFLCHCKASPFSCIFCRKSAVSEAAEELIRRLLVSGSFCVRVSVLAPASNKSRISPTHTLYYVSTPLLSWVLFIHHPLRSISYAVGLQLEDNKVSGMPEIYTRPTTVAFILSTVLPLQVTVLSRWTRSRYTRRKENRRSDVESHRMFEY